MHPVKWVLTNIFTHQTATAIKMEHLQILKVPCLSLINAYQHPSPRQLLICLSEQKFTFGFAYRICSERNKIGNLLLFLIVFIQNKAVEILPYHYLQQKLVLSLDQIVFCPFNGHIIIISSFIQLLIDMKVIFSLDYALNKASMIIICKYLNRKLF